ncbi:MAG: hypothetical protein HOP22_14095 [Nitrospiraceae bacterium]|nr:hypothetical protein [Nitrospiraceae bacterium]
MRIEYTKGERASKELIMLHREASDAVSGRKMKVLLIYPPDWFPSEPYLSLPSLTAVLRQADRWKRGQATFSCALIHAACTVRTCRHYAA